jgi:hypothetical protein
VFPNQNAPKEISQLYQIYSTAIAKEFKEVLNTSQKDNSEKLERGISSAKETAKNIKQFKEEVAKLELEVSKLDKDISEKELKVKQFENSEKVLNEIEKTMEGITITDKEKNDYNLLENYNHSKVLERHSSHEFGMEKNDCSTTKPIVEGLQKVMQKINTDSENKFVGFSGTVENIVKSIQNTDKDNPYTYNDFVNDFTKSKEEFITLKEGILKTKGELKNLESSKETADTNLNQNKGFLEKNQKLHEEAKKEIQNIRSEIQNTYIKAFKENIKAAIEKVGAKTLNASQSPQASHNKIIAYIENKAGKLANKILTISKTPDPKKGEQEKVIMGDVQSFINTEISPIIAKKINLEGFKPMQGHNWTTQNNSNKGGLAV